MDKIDKYKNITLEEIKSKIKEIFKPSITHYSWEEDGKKYSSWKIDTGNQIINCNDAAKELIDKAFMEKFNS